VVAHGDHGILARGDGPEIGVDAEPPDLIGVPEIKTFPKNVHLISSGADDRTVELRSRGG
jgi:hypothetical protein